MHVASDVDGGGVGLVCQDGFWQFVVKGENGYAKVKFPAKATEVRDVHLAGVYDGKNLMLFLDGELKAIEPFPSKVVASPTHFVIGANPGENTPVPNSKKTAGNSYYQFFKGTIKRVRISKIARYTGNYSPEDQFSKDESTMALYHFHEGAGDVLTDSSGNGHHGKIHGATWINTDGSSLKE